MRTFLRSKATLLFLTVGLLLAGTAVAAIAAELVTAEVDADTNATMIEVEQGKSANFDIKLSATGNLAAATETSPSTAAVHTSYSITKNTDGTISKTSGTFSSSKSFWGDSSGTATWTGAPTPYSVPASVSVGSDVPVGTYNYTLSTSAGTTQVTNPSGSGGKLNDTTATTITIKVVAPSDTTAPQVSSISRDNADPTNASSVSWTATFSEAVTGVDTSDFSLVASSGLTGTSITSVAPIASSSGKSYTVTASTGSGDGTLRLDLVDNNSIIDGANNALVGPSGADGGFTGQAYTIDRTGPNVTLTDVNGSARTFPYYTNQNVTSVGGACETGGSVVTVKVDGTADAATATCSNTGTWSLTLTNALSSEATYGFVAYQDDALGNAGNSGASKSVQIDTTRPTVTPSALLGPNFTGAYTEGNWTNQSVRVTFGCADNAGGSGLTAASGPQTLADYTTNSADANGTQANFSGTCTDKAGNSANSDLDFTLKIDKTNPSLGTIVDNNALSSNVCTASGPPTQPTGFDPSDGLSGLNQSSTSLTGETWTVPGASTFPFGNYSYSAVATDNATNSASYSKTYSYTYGLGSGGLAYNGVLQPINMPPATGTFVPSIFKLGSTVPVKFTVSCGQTPYDGAVAGLFVKKSDSTVAGDVNEALSTAASTTGNLFRYDATSGQYIFNLSTKQGYTDANNQTQKFSQGSWIITIKFADGTTKTATFDLK